MIVAARNFGPVRLEDTAWNEVVDEKPDLFATPLGSVLIGARFSFPLSKRSVRDSLPNAL